jgi:aspartate/methionine/tyrosine aminotransferase
MPTGKRASLELFQKLVDFGRKHNIVIVNDNPYSFILNDKPLSIFNIEGAKDIAIEMNSLSKSHNMPGWRIGMLASNPTFIQWILKVKSNIDSGQFRPMMKAAIEALKQGQEWYDDVNSTYAKRRLIAEEIMNTLGCHFDPKQSGLFLWGRIPNDAASSEALADDILYNARVFITPGFIFGSNGDRYIRISLCATEEKMNEALNRIKQLVNNQ